MTGRRLTTERRSNPSLLSAMDEYWDYREVTGESPGAVDHDADDRGTYLPAAAETRKPRIG